MPVLNTKRLVLRKVTLQDAKDIYEYAKDPVVSKYTLWSRHRNLTDSLKFVKYITSNYRKGVEENWGIVYKAENKLIGTIGFFNWDEANNKAEIHYALSNKYAGLGLMTEAAKAVIEFGFDKMHLNRIEAKCMLKNFASEKVMQKCGMKYESIMRAGLLVKGRYVDLKTYAVLKRWL